METDEEEASEKEASQDPETPTPDVTGTAVPSPQARGNAVSRRPARGRAGMAMGTEKGPEAEAGAIAEADKRQKELVAGPSATRQVDDALESQPRSLRPARKMSRREQLLLYDSPAVAEVGVAPACCQLTAVRCKPGTAT